ncbi:hypothetical protein Q5752_003336 [Cryptotrichosporon argae]
MSAPLLTPLDHTLHGRSASSLPPAPYASSSSSSSASQPRTYRLHTPDGADYLDFGSVIINSPTVRLVRVENLTARALALDISPSQPEDVELYVRAIDAPPSPSRKGKGKYGDEASGGAALERFRTVADGEMKERFMEALQDGQDKGKSRVDELQRETSGAKVGRDDKTVLVALKRGGKGRTVQIYGDAVVFKDRALLDDLEYLDLSAGPPVCARRTARAKWPFALEGIELADKARLSGRIQKLDASKHRKKRDKSVAPTVAEIKAAEAELKPKPEPKPKPVSRPSTPPSDIAALSIEDLISAMDRSDAGRVAVADSGAEEEEAYVRRLRALRKDFHRRIAVGRLVPAQAVHVAPHATKTLFVVLTPNSSTRPHITARAKRADSRLFVRLVDNEEVSENGETDAPITDLILRSSCARSVLEVQQSSVNFGTCVRGETKLRTIVLHNRSDCVGIFRMRLSGSISSSNLALGLGRYGVIPAYGRRQVESFSFTPGLVGSFQETIVVENVLDPLNNQSLLVKATVVKPPAFTVDVERVEFGKGLEGGAQAFVLTNTSKGERAFVLEAKAVGDAFAELRLARDDKDAGLALSKGEEEEVETLLQKLKIARRKGKADKVEKYEKRLAELHIEVDAAAGAGSADSVQTQAPGTTRLVVALAPSQKAKIYASLIAAGGAASLASFITIHDEKNTDETLVLPVSASPPFPAPRRAQTTREPTHLALMRHCLALTLRCPVSPTAFCVGSVLFLPRDDELFDALKDIQAFRPFKVDGDVAGLILGEGYSRQIPGNTHAEANALANFRAAYDEDESSSTSASASARVSSASSSPSISFEPMPSSPPGPSADAILAAAACYATMEPCSVRTSGGPSCALELVRARVKRVYLGVEEPADFVVCEGVQILEGGGVEVWRVEGLEEECLTAARRGRD